MKLCHASKPAVFRKGCAEQHSTVGAEGISEKSIHRKTTVTTSLTNDCLFHLLAHTVMMIKVVCTCKYIILKSAIFNQFMLSFKDQSTRKRRQSHPCPSHMHTHRVKQKMYMHTGQLSFKNVFVGCWHDLTFNLLPGSANVFTPVCNKMDHPQRTISNICCQSSNMSFRAKFRVFGKI